MEVDRILEVAHTKDAETGEVGISVLTLLKCLPCLSRVLLVLSTRGLCFNGLCVLCHREGFLDHQYRIDFSNVVGRT